MKKKLLALPLLALLVIGVGVILYRAMERQNGDAGRIVLYGNIDLRVTNLAFETNGRILAMPVNEGAAVAPGQLVARLDDRQLTLARDRVAGQLAAQRAQLDKLIAGARPEEIEKLRADLDAAESEAKNMARRAERSRDLADRKLISPQDYDDARTAAEAAKARAGAARAALDLALAGTRAEEIAAARAQVAALEAELALAEVQLGYTRLHALAAGIVQNRILEPGDMASPERPVYTLALTEPVWARVYLAEPDLGRVRPGLPAEVASDSFPGKIYRAWLGYIAPSAEFTPKTVQTTELRADLVYQARVYVCNPQDELRLGMPVTVTLDLAAEPIADPGCGPDAERP
ncbi:efflux RND transporter periplasmic adaptor subunit [Thioflavicoccus mobilis]|uniref:efflux RND transporter periplasmic adaptor subunit n=1 Tax=Thioflavicoccus mobilis TaxID=80679 RepID=UPI0005A151F9|nr:efflux RND transporter periplasmic adaptor subunit [Thioflavicoccus mobilis]